MKENWRRALSVFCLLIAFLQGCKSSGTIQKQATDAAYMEALELGEVRFKQYEKDIRNLTARNAIDCGFATNGEFPKPSAPVDTCAIAALQKRKPFVARYIESINQEASTETLIGDNKGHVYFFSLYQWAVDARTDARGPHQCKHPTVAYTGGHMRIICPHRPKPKRRITDQQQANKIKSA